MNFWVVLTSDNPKLLSNVIISQSLEAHLKCSSHNPELLQNIILSQTSEAYIRSSLSLSGVLVLCNPKTWIRNIKWWYSTAARVQNTSLWTQKKQILHSSPASSPCSNILWVKAWASNHVFLPYDPLQATLPNKQPCAALVKKPITQEQTQIKPCHYSTNYVTLCPFWLIPKSLN